MPALSGSGPPQGLVEAARQLGLPLPQAVTCSPPNSAPARLRSQGTSPDSARSEPKRPASSGDKASEVGTEEEYRRIRRRLTNREAAARTRRRGKESLQAALEQSHAVSEAYRRLQGVHVAATARVQELQGEVSRWHGLAHKLEAEALDLRCRLALCEMQLDSAQQRVQAAQPPPPAAQPPAAAQAACFPDFPGWENAALPSSVPPACADVPMTAAAGCAELPQPEDAPAWLGMAGPTGPATCCGLQGLPAPTSAAAHFTDEWDDVLLLHEIL